MNAVILVLLFFAVLYLWLMMPRTAERPDCTAFLGRYYAHRGLHDNTSDAPENSPAAIRKAVENGYGIEFDVQLTKDRIPVVFHDEKLKRVCGTEGNVRDYTFEELQAFPLCGTEERIPKLADVLALVNGQVPLIIEIKIHENADAVCVAVDELVQAYHGAYCVESFHPAAVRWYSKNRPEVLRGQLSSNFAQQDGRESLGQWLVHHLLTNAGCRPDFIAYNHRYRKNVSYRICKALFRPLCVTWVVRSQEELEACRQDFDLFIFEDFLPKD